MNKAGRQYVDKMFKLAKKHDIKIEKWEGSRLYERLMRLGQEKRMYELTRLELEKVAQATLIEGDYEKLTFT